MNLLNKTSAVLVIAGAASLAATSAVAAPETYVVDGSHTFPSFSYSHFGLSTQISRFNNTTGTLVVDKAAKTGQVDISIDMTSVDTGFELFDEHIQSEEFFDTATYPTATFKSSKVYFKDDAPVAVDGDLTIKGITKPVTLDITHFVTMQHPMLEKDAIGANAQVVVKRTEFNAGKYAPNVGDEVTISVSLEAVKE